MVVDIFVRAIDFVLAPLAIFPPYVTILLVSALITFMIVALNRVIVNKKFIEEIRHRMEQLKENITQAQKENDKENLQKFLNELMHVNNQYMKHTFKTLIVSLIIVSIFLPWLGYKYSGLAINVPFNLPFTGAHIEWLYWYILVSLAAGWILRKLFGATV